MSIDRYHFQDHIEQYDTKYVGMPGAEIEIVTDAIDELLYPERSDLTNVSASSARVNSSTIFTSFSHEYLRADSSEWYWPLERVRLSIDHSVFLGKSAVKQCYKIKLDNSVLQQTHDQDSNIVPLHNRVTTMFYLSQISGEDSVYEGRILRPNILSEPDLSDEPMSVYDCHHLYTSIEEIRIVAEGDAQEAQAIRYM